MSNWIKISNSGLIEEEALTLLGASSKRNDSSKIGMFGSGNKYALAFFKRNNIDIRIFSGKNEIEIDLVEKHFKNKTFRVLSINGKETSITTEFGPKWKLWQAVREIYCNSLDEGNSSLSFVDGINPKDEETHFYIRNTSDLQSLIDDFDKYFSQRREVLYKSFTGNKILKKLEGDSELRLYRKGILCFESDKDSIFDYDFVNLNLDENRLVIDHYTISNKIWDLIFTCNNKEIIREFLKYSYRDGFIESDQSLIGKPDVKLISSTFEEVLREKPIATVSLSGLLSLEEKLSCWMLPDHIFNAIELYYEDIPKAGIFSLYKNIKYKEITPSPLIEATLKKAEDFLTECRYNLPLKYHWKVVSIHSSSIKSFSRDTTIFISENTIEDGVVSLLHVLIQEAISIKNHHPPEINMNSRIISELIQVLKSQNAYPL